ncbi:MAG: PEP/pyruvate-binding domain-containing protein [Streptosporangiaceae bacterium]
MPLADAVEADIAGGKAAGLARLFGLGVAVPDGWVLTSEAIRMHRRGELGDAEFDSLIRDRMLAGLHPVSHRFAVRSSAAVEDSAQASYAGQFRTELNVARHEVPAAVRRVADSVTGQAARSYARRLGLPAPESMAVIVQEQVSPSLAGVCLTAHPVTGAPALVLEYAYGLGDTVVSGGALAGSLVLPQCEDGGLAERQLADVGPPASTWLRGVALLASKLATILGSPQDVEWAVDHRGLWVVQTRPISTVGAPSSSRHLAAASRGESRRSNGE